MGPGGAVGMRRVVYGLSAGGNKAVLQTVAAVDTLWTQSQDSQRWLAVVVLVVGVDASGPDGAADGWGQRMMAWPDGLCWGTETQRRKQWFSDVYYLFLSVHVLNLTASSPICAENPLLAMFLARTASLMRSTSCWYRLRSLMAFSLASFRAFSRALTRSAVARRRFSSLGSSQRRSALSRTSWGQVAKSG